MVGANTMGAAKRALREQGLQHMAAKLGQLSKIRIKVAHPRQLAQVLTAIRKAGNSIEYVQGMGKKDARTKSVGSGVETSEEEPEREHEQAKHEEASHTFDSVGSQVVQEHEQATHKAMELLARRLQVVEARLDLLLSGEEGQELSAPKTAGTSAAHIINAENMGSDEVDLNEITSSGEPDFLKGDGVEVDEMAGDIMQIEGLKDEECKRGDEPNIEEVKEPNIDETQEGGGRMIGTIAKAKIQDKPDVDGRTKIQDKPDEDAKLQLEDTFIDNAKAKSQDKPDEDAKTKIQGKPDEDAKAVEHAAGVSDGLNVMEMLLKVREQQLQIMAELRDERAAGKALRTHAKIG